MIDSTERLPHLLMKESNEIQDDESFVSNSPMADHETLINDIETENIELLKNLSYNRNLRALSPVITSDDLLTSKNSESFNKPTVPSSVPSVDIKTEMNETIIPSGGNELEKKDRPLVEGTDKVK